MSLSKTAQVLDIIHKAGIIRAKDLRAQGIHQQYLLRLTHQGLIVRSGRGLYTLPNLDLTEHQSLLEACIRVPSGIVCLFSALRFHSLTSQSPFEIWLAIANKARPPKDDVLPLHFVYMSGNALSEGVEEHFVAGFSIRVFNVPKTIADCFKYRNKIGLEVALEALQDCWHSRRCTMDDLWHYAKICRVANVMRPYLESLI
jgi:predicted transcriptional regulator of viral defense system